MAIGAVRSLQYNTILKDLHFHYTPCGTHEKGSECIPLFMFPILLIYLRTGKGYFSRYLQIKANLLDTDSHYFEFN